MASSGASAFRTDPALDHLRLNDRRDQAGGDTDACEREAPAARGYRAQNAGNTEPAHTTMESVQVFHHAKLRLDPALLIGTKAWKISRPEPSSTTRNENSYS